MELMAGLPDPQSVSLTWSMVNGTAVTHRRVVTSLYHPTKGLVRTASIRKAASQKMTLRCLTAAGTTACAGYLSTDCDSTDDDGGRLSGAIKGTASSSLVATTSAKGLAGEEFELTVDASELTPGVNYKICIDTDGPLLEHAFGDCQVFAHVSPIASTPVVSIPRQNPSPLPIFCSNDTACTSTMMMDICHETEECDTTASGQKSSQSASANTEGDYLTPTNGAYRGQGVSQRPARRRLSHPRRR
jgi:hypothetical protein